MAASPQRSQRQRQSGANEDSSVEGVSGLGSGGMGVLPVERALGSGATCRSRDRREQQHRRDRERQRSRFAARVWEDNAYRGSCPAVTGEGQPLVGEAKTMVVAGARGTPNPRHHPGPGTPSKKRLTGVNVDGVVPEPPQSVRVEEQGPKTVVGPAQVGSRPGNSTVSQGARS